ncbi:MAG: Na(+)/H(+) antiporter subunit D [Lysobacterales bacterium]
MLEFVLPPALVLFLGALLVAVVRPAARAPIVLATPLLALWAVWQLGDGVHLQTEFLGYRIDLVEADRLRRLFATIFSLMAFAGGLFGLRQARTHELAAAFAYAGGALGVCFAGDLISLFLFWEMMAVFSTVLVWSGGSEAARRAGIRYAILHVLGGVLLMFGIVAQLVSGGSVEIVPLPLDQPGHWLILVGVLLNAAAPPLSAWIADAYPEASPSGSVFLSAFTTKAAVLVLILLFPGAPLLIPVGLFMIFYGIIYALLENDMRRVLAYSIVNQVGFMLVGIGIGSELAINGAAAHAFVHILYKGLLFMSAGAVLAATGKRRLSELGGLVQSMPVTAICGIVGALSISAFPLTSGFIAKSMISAGAAEQHLVWVWYLLTAASAGVFLHAGIKFPWFVFFQKDSGLRPTDPPWNMQAAMILLSIACIAIGCAPAWLYALLPYPVEYLPYTAAHVLAQSQLLLFAGLAFFLMLPMMRRTLTISLDVDWLYRRLLPASATWLFARWDQLQSLLRSGTTRYLERPLRKLYSYHQAGGLLARTWPTGSMALWVVSLLVLMVWFGRG